MLCLICSAFYFFIIFLMILRPLRYTLFPYTTLFRSGVGDVPAVRSEGAHPQLLHGADLRCVIAHQRQLLHAAEEPRSEEHTSELQSHSDLVCRLLLEKKNNK